MGRLLFETPNTARVAEVPNPTEHQDRPLRQEPGQSSPEAPMRALLYTLEKGVDLINILVVEPGVVLYEKGINGLEEMQAVAGYTTWKKIFGRQVKRG